MFCFFHLSWSRRVLFLIQIEELPSTRAHRLLTRQLVRVVRFSVLWGRADGYIEETITLLYQ
jgi:hypothetical protein